MLLLSDGCINCGLMKENPANSAWSMLAITSSSGGVSWGWVRVKNLSKFSAALPHCRKKTQEKQKFRYKVWQITWSVQADRQDRADMKNLEHWQRYVHGNSAKTRDNQQNLYFFELFTNEPKAQDTHHYQTSSISTISITIHMKSKCGGQLDNVHWTVQQASFSCSHGLHINGKHFTPEPHCYMQ